MVRRRNPINMKTFKDLEGREWKISLNGWTLERVKEGANVLLTKLIDDDCKLLVALHDEPLLLVSVLWHMVEEEANDRDISKRDFAMSLAGDVLDEARKALIASIVDFFDDPARRRAIANLVEKATQVGQAVMAKAEQEVNKLVSTDTDVIVSSGSLQEFAESTQGHTP